MTRGQAFRASMWLALASFSIIATGQMASDAAQRFNEDDMGKFVGSAGASTFGGLITLLMMAGTVAEFRYEPSKDPHRIRRIEEIED